MIRCHYNDINNLTPVDVKCIVYIRAYIDKTVLKLGT